VRHFYRNKVANVIGAVGAVGGFAALVYKLAQQVGSGRGLDHYIAMSGQEWSPLAALILIVVIVAVLTVSGVLRWMSGRRLHSGGTSQATRPQAGKGALRAKRLP
jgi:hypothetical protein